MSYDFFVFVFFSFLLIWFCFLVLGDAKPAGKRKKRKKQRAARKERKKKLSPHNNNKKKTRPRPFSSKKKKNRIKKCRYLQESGCVGLCTNLCKRPTEAFFADAFGLPLTMEPDFETLECTMRFGQAPPPIEEDAVYNQPCFSAVCSMASPSGPCPKIDTDRAK